MKKLFYLATLSLSLNAFALEVSCSMPEGFMGMNTVVNAELEPTGESSGGYELLGGSMEVLISNGATIVIEAQSVEVKGVELMNGSLNMIPVDLPEMGAIYIHHSPELISFVEYENKSYKTSCTIK